MTEIIDGRGTKRYCDMKKMAVEEEGVADLGLRTEATASLTGDSAIKIELNCHMHNNYPFPLCHQLHFFCSRIISLVSWSRRKFKNTDLSYVEITKFVYLIALMSISVSIT